MMCNVFSVVAQAQMRQQHQQQQQRQTLAQLLPHAQQNGTQSSAVGQAQHAQLEQQPTVSASMASAPAASQQHPQTAPVPQQHAGRLSGPCTSSLDVCASGTSAHEIVAVHALSNLTSCSLALQDADVLDADPVVKKVESSRNGYHEHESATETLQRL